MSNHFAKFTNIAKGPVDLSEELKDQRIVTMMAPTELKAIDDWGFANRIRSRGEAIRRLCQIALAYDENMPALNKAIDHLFGKALELLETIDLKSDAAPVANALIKGIMEAFDAQVALIVQAQSFKEAGEIQALLTKSAEIKQIIGEKSPMKRILEMSAEERDEMFSRLKANRSAKD